MSAAGSDEGGAPIDDDAAPGDDELKAEKAAAQKAVAKKVAAQKAATKKARVTEQAAATNVDESEAASFVEGNHETVMTYGHGGFPKFIMAVWVCFLVGYAVYFYVYGLPDLTAWGSP